MTQEKEARRARMWLSLEGLSIGDALGERFFFRGTRAPQMIAGRVLPNAPWEYTDDTRMALSIAAILHEYDGIDQDALVRHFGKLYVEQPRRGYGAAMHDLLPALHSGVAFEQAASSLFGGTGSFGNGAAMRIAPLGAYFADDLGRVVMEAERSCRVTHAHPEAVAGAVAVAVATAHAIAWHEARQKDSWRTFIDAVLQDVPASEVADNIQVARDLPDHLTIQEIGSSKLLMN